VLVSDWATALAPHGLRPLHVVGQGMEGVVLRVEGDLVVKVWRHRTSEELAVLQAFYEVVSLPVRTTRLLDVVPVGERWASIEPHLAGEPMTAELRDADVAAVADVLDALAEAPAGPALTALPALPGEPPLAVTTGFGPGLADLVERRASPVLARAVPDLADVVVAVTGRLRSMPADAGRGPGPGARRPGRGQPARGRPATPGRGPGLRVPHHGRRPGLRRGGDEQRVRHVRRGRAAHGGAVAGGVHA
jgi:hypothetical protein